MRLEINTTDAIGGVLVATFTIVTSTTYTKMFRELIITDAVTNTGSYPGATSAITDIISQTATFASNAIDWTADQYLVVSFQTASAVDSISCRGISILGK